MNQNSLDLPSGHTCANCNRHAKFSAWAFAHWHELLTHTCECGARTELMRGRPVRLYPPKGFHTSRGSELDTYGERYGIERLSKGAWLEDDHAYRARILGELSRNHPSTTKGNQS